MATDVTIDARTEGGSTGGLTSLAWNHTVGAALVNPFLTVELTSGTTTAVSPTSVQWDAAGGSPQGLAPKATVTEPGGNCKTEIWGVVPTATGTKQVKVNFAASVEITGGSASYQYVNQTTPYNAASPQSATFGGGTTLSLTVTSAAHEMVITCVVENGGSALTVPAGQSVIHNDNIGASQHAGASADAAGAATVACAYGGVTTSNTRAIVGVSLRFDPGPSFTPDDDAWSKPILFPDRAEVGVWN